MHHFQTFIFCCKVPFVSCQFLINIHAEIFWHPFHMCWGCAASLCEISEATNLYYSREINASCFPYIVNKSIFCSLSTFRYTRFWCCGNREQIIAVAQVFCMKSSRVSYSLTSIMVCKPWSPRIKPKHQSFICSWGVDRVVAWILYLPPYYMYLLWLVMHQSFVTPAPPPTGIAGLMCGAVTFWVPPQYWVSAGLVILRKYTPRNLLL